MLRHWRRRARRGRASRSRRSPSPGRRCRAAASVAAVLRRRRRSRCSWRCLPAFAIRLACRGRHARRPHGSSAPGSSAGTVRRGRRPRPAATSTRPRPRSTPRTTTSSMCSSCSRRLRSASPSPSPPAAGRSSRPPLDRGGDRLAATVMPARNTRRDGRVLRHRRALADRRRGARDRRGLVPRRRRARGRHRRRARRRGGAGASPSVAALDWQNWDLFGQSRAQRTVALIWSSDYGGVDFPPGEDDRAADHRAAPRALLAGDDARPLRVATAGSSRSTPPTSAGANRALPADPLLPVRGARTGPLGEAGGRRPRARRRPRRRREPADADRGRRRRTAIQYQSGGVMRRPSGLGEHAPLHGVELRRRGRRPPQLVRSPPSYPARSPAISTSAARRAGLRRSAARSAIVASLFRDDALPAAVAVRSRSGGRRAALTAGAQTPVPGDAPIERWLRSDGGFGYDEHPPAPAGAAAARRLPRSARSSATASSSPGSMALMLRYLGIPARVAVGFTSGTWKDGTWTVTDHDAHAWVEAWFAGLRLAHVRPDAGPRQPHRPRTRTPRTRPTRSARSARAASSAPGARRRGRRRARRRRRPSSPAPTRVRVAVPAPASRAPRVALSRARRCEARAARSARAAPTIRARSRRRRAPTSSTSSATRARRCSPAAPIGELVAELRRLGVCERRLRGRVLARPLRAAAGRRGGRRRDAPRAGRVLSLPAGPARAGAEGPRLPRRALAARRLTAQARYER